MYSVAYKLGPAPTATCVMTSYPPGKGVTMPHYLFLCDAALPREFPPTSHEANTVRYNVPLFFTPALRKCGRRNGDTGAPTWEGMSQNVTRESQAFARWVTNFVGEDRMITIEITNY